MSRQLDDEKLEVYQVALAFIAWLEPILRRLPKGLAVVDRLDRAGTSMPLNLAEGNGKFTGPDRRRYFDNARGSALESAGALDVLGAKGHCTEQEVELGKARLRSIVQCSSASLGATPTTDCTSQAQIRSRIRITIRIRITSTVLLRCTRGSTSSRENS